MIPRIWKYLILSCHFSHAPRTAMRVLDWLKSWLVTLNGEPQPQEVRPIEWLTRILTYSLARLDVMELLFGFYASMSDTNTIAAPETTQIGIA